MSTPIQRALISVSDKTGINNLALTLVQQGIEIIATGGTHRQLVQAGIPAIEISKYTGFPEIMDGRVKTLHPKIHGGILGRRQGKASEQDRKTMAEMDIPGIDLVVINLYPFRETISRAHSSFADAIENIDIGGPAMLRAAAKNHASVLVVVDPEDYASVAEAIETDTSDEQMRLYLAAKAFQHTASYDGAIANYLGGLEAEGASTLGRYFNFSLERAQSLRYGENPHQQAALYSTSPKAGLAAAKQLQGKALSYNNINDTETAWRLACSFSQPSCVIVKHANPCGVASALDTLTAYQNAYRTDPVSAFGGVIAFNCTLSAEVIAVIAKQQFIEVIIAPAVTGDVKAALGKRKNVRLLTADVVVPAATLELHSITGGLLVQERDEQGLNKDNLQVVTKRAPTEAEYQSLCFAWTVAKFVKSNAMVLASGTSTIGIGAGQMSRVYSTRIAAIKAQDEGLETKNTVLASDAFLPFRDGLDEAAKIGVSALIQPGGSVRDQEVIDAANESDVAMMFTGIRHFRH